MNVFEPADYHRHADDDDLVVCMQKGSVTGYIDRMKLIVYKVHGTTDDKMMRSLYSEVGANHWS